VLNLIGPGMSCEEMQLLGLCSIIMTTADMIFGMIPEVRKIG